MKFRIICMNASILQPDDMYVHTSDIFLPKMSNEAIVRNKNKNQCTWRILSLSHTHAHAHTNAHMNHYATFVHQRVWQQHKDKNNISEINCMRICERQTNLWKQFRKSYKMVSVNYGRIRYGYRNSSIFGSLHCIGLDCIWNVTATKRITRINRLMFGFLVSIWFWFWFGKKECNRIRKKTFK